MLKIFKMTVLSLGLALLICAPAEAKVIVKDIDTECSTNTTCGTTVQGSICLGELHQNVPIWSECPQYPGHQCKCGCLDRSDCNNWKSHPIRSGPRCIPSATFDAPHCGCHYDAHCNPDGMHTYYCSRMPGPNFLTCQPLKKVKGRK